MPTTPDRSPPTQKGEKQPVTAPVLLRVGTPFEPYWNWIGLAVLTERDALQRTRGDQAVLRILEHLRVFDDAILRQPVVGQRDRSHLERGRVVPVAAIGARAKAEAESRDAFFLAVFAAQHDMQPVVEERAAPGDLRGAVLVVAVGRDAGFHVGADAFELSCR